MREEGAEADGEAHGVWPPLRCSPHDIRARRRADGRRREAVGEASFQLMALDGLGVAVRPVWKSKFYGAFVQNRRVDLHAIDATPALIARQSQHGLIAVKFFDFHTASDGSNVA